MVVGPKKIVVIKVEVQPVKARHATEGEPDEIIGVIVGMDAHFMKQEWVRTMLPRWFNGNAT